MAVLYRPLARADAARPVRFIAERDRAAAARLRRAIRRTAERVDRGETSGEFIGQGTSLSDLRRIAVDEFREHQLFYVNAVFGVEVIRLRHSREDWQGELDRGEFG